MFFIVFNDIETVSLIKKAQKGDEAAFCLLIEEIEPFVYNLALRMMDGRRSDAEDMSQEALLRVYRAISSYKGNASFKTWALRICKNTCLDEIRRRKARITQTEEISPLLADKTDVQEQVLSAERRRCLLKAIASLEERPKTLIVLRDINGLSYREISEIMDMEEGTVKSALNRARKKLRGIIEEQNLI